MSDRTPFRVEQIRLDARDRFPLTVGADGMPSWWPNLYYSVALRPSGLGFSTMQSRMKRSHGLQTKAHIAAVAEMVAREWPEPFPEQFIELSPVLEEAFGGMRSPAM